MHFLHDVSSHADVGGGGGGGGRGKRERERERGEWRVRLRGGRERRVRFNTYIHTPHTLTPCASDMKRRISFRSASCIRTAAFSSQLHTECTSLQ